MSNYSEAAKQHHEISLQYEHKYILFFVALIFSILGLAIETSTPSKNYFQIIFELSGWLFLLLSGILGLVILQESAAYYRFQSENSSLWNELNSLLSQKEMGKENIPWLESSRADEVRHIMRPIDDVIRDKENSLKQIVSERDTVQKDVVLKINIQGITFTIGIIGLIISRGWDHIAYIIINS